MFDLAVDKSNQTTNVTMDKVISQPRAVERAIRLFSSVALAAPQSYNGKVSKFYNHFGDRIYSASGPYP